ncbi:MAG: Gx transporter family protein [Syntrophomonadaceae bacterium]|nr:Gx transporter family protein [Syntrophomonadaceae bacterium]
MINVRKPDAFSTDDPYQRTRKMVFIAMLVGLSMVLSYLERLLPLSFTIPGIKLGLANLVILAGMYLLTFRQALALVLLKCFMTAWVFGSFSAFLYSVTGSFLSFCLMSVLLYGSRFKINIIIVSIIGALGHNFGQIMVAAVVIKSTKIFYYAPVLALAGVITGMIIGFCVRSFLFYVSEYKEKTWNLK